MNVKDIDWTEIKGWQYEDLFAYTLGYLDYTVTDDDEDIAVREYAKELLNDLMGQLSIESDREWD